MHEVGCDRRRERTGRAGSNSFSRDARRAVRHGVAEPLPDRRVGAADMLNLFVR
jgi:hypothetical protein